MKQTSHIRYVLLNTHISIVRVLSSLSQFCKREWKLLIGGTQDKLLSKWGVGAGPITPLMKTISNLWKSEVYHNYVPLICLHYTVDALLLLVKLEFEIQNKNLSLGSINDSIPVHQILIKQIELLH